MEMNEITDQMRYMPKVTQPGSTIAWRESNTEKAVLGPQYTPILCMHVFCGPSSASEMFIIFATHLYSFPCTSNHSISCHRSKRNTLVYSILMIDKKGILQQEHSQPPTLPSGLLDW